MSRTNEESDGYTGTSPVDEYEPNGYGIYNMCGNVWEWVQDFWTTSHSVPETALQPLIDPRGPDGGTEHTQKGGSFLSSRSADHGYRAEARTHGATRSRSGCVGFRCAMSEETGVCADATRACAAYARLGQCVHNVAFMRRHCKLSCGICTPSQEVPPARVRRRRLKAWVEAEQAIPSCTPIPTPHHLIAALSPQHPPPSPHT